MYIPERAVGTQCEKIEIWIIEKIHGAHTFWQNVDYTDGNQSIIKPILLMEGTITAWWTTCMLFKLFFFKQKIFLF